jgi:hypothetical protein
MGGFHARHVHAVPLRFLAETIRRFRFAPEMSDEGPKLLNLLDTWGSEHWSAKTQKANIELLRDRLKIVDAENASLQKRVVELERDLKTAKDALAQMHQHNVELRANAEQPSAEDKLTRGHIKVLALIGKTGRASDEAVMDKLKPVSRAEVRYLLESLSELKLTHRWAYEDTGWQNEILFPGREILYKRGML